MLDLLRPIYSKTAAYGHFGREEPEFSWERTDKAAAAACGSRVVSPPCVSKVSARWTRPGRHSDVSRGQSFSEPRSERPLLSRRLTSAKGSQGPKVGPQPTDQPRLASARCLPAA